MAQTDEEIGIGIKVIFDGFKSALSEAASNVRESTEQMKASYESLNGAVEKVRSVMLGITAVLAGGAMFKESIESAERFTESVVLLKERLGTTMEEASAMKLALDAVGLSSEAAAGLVQKMDRQIRTNSEGLAQMGVHLKDDVTGNLRNGTDVLMDTIKVLGEYREGTDRNIAMQVAFGRASGITYDQLQRFTEAMDTAKARGAALNLILGPDAKESMESYQRATNEAKAVLEAFEIAIGRALMPALQGVSDWFREYGPAALNAFKVVFEPFIGLFDLFRNGLQTIATTAVAVFATLRTAASLGWTAIKDALSGNAFRAEADWAAATIKIREYWASASKDIIDNAKRASDAIMQIGQPDAHKNGGEQGGGKSASNLLKPGAGGTSAFEEYKNTLQQMKIDKQDFFKEDLASDIAYWEAKKGLQANTAKDELSIDGELYNLKKQLAQQQLREQLETIAEQIKAVKGNYEQQELLATNAANLIASKYGYESSEFRKATAEILQYAQQRQKELDNLAMREIEAKRAHIDQVTAMELEQARHLNALQITNDDQYLAEQRRLNEAQYQADLAALEERLNFLAVYSDAYQQTLDKILAMVDKHNLDVQKAEDQAVEQHVKTMEGYLAPVNSAIEQSINGMIQGTQTLQKAMANIGQSILAEFVKLAVQRLTDWIAVEIGMTSATIAGTTARTTAEVAGAAAGKEAKNAAGMSSILKDAYEAAAAAYKAVVGIPFIGPVLAPIAAGVAFGAVAAYRSAFSSAEGGYDIPAGVNPLTQLHAREMVLPADIADPMRAALAGGGGFGGPVVNYHDYSGRLSEAEIRRNASVIVDVLKGEVRRFNAPAMTR